MGLQAAFDLELSSKDETKLSRLRAMAIQQLKAGVKSHRHPWHTGVVSTIDGERPRVRTVVLQAVEDHPLCLRFHTDVRSTKIDQLRQKPQVEWLFYEPSTRIQLRAETSASIVTQGDTWISAWNKTSLSSRRCYLGPQPPGTETSGPSHNLPDALLGRDPTHKESEPGQSNFAIIECVVQSLEWLYLKQSGHLRCSFANLDNSWTETWIAP